MAIHAAANPPVLIIRNRTALFGWIFIAFFLTICALFSYLLVRDGPGNVPIHPPENMSRYPAWALPAVNMVFWFGGVAAAVHIGRIPMVRVEVRSDRSVVVACRYPLGVESRCITNDQLCAARVFESVDSEGDAYFECRLRAADGFAVTIAESSSREHCETICADFNLVIGKPSAGPVTHQCS